MIIKISGYFSVAKHLKKLLGVTGHLSHLGIPPVLQIHLRVKNVSKFFEERSRHKFKKILKKLQTAFIFSKNDFVKKTKSHDVHEHKLTKQSSRIAVYWEKKDRKNSSCLSSTWCSVCWKLKNFSAGTFQLKRVENPWKKISIFNRQNITLPTARVFHLFLFISIYTRSTWYVNTLRLHYRKPRETAHPIAISLVRSVALSLE